MDVLGSLEVEAAKELIKLLMGGLAEVAKKVSVLWRRSGERKQELMAKELERSARELSNAPEPAQTQMRHEALWEGRLRDLLAEHPDASAELQELITVLRSVTSGPSAPNVQIGIARDNGRQFQVQSGDLHYHEARQEPPQSTPEEPQK